MAAIFQGGSDHLYQFMKGQERKVIRTITDSDYLLMHQEDQAGYPMYSILFDGEHYVNFYPCSTQWGACLYVYTDIANLYMIAHGQGTYEGVQGYIYTDEPEFIPSEEAELPACYAELSDTPSYDICEFVTDIYLYEWNSEWQYALFAYAGGNFQILEDEFAREDLLRYHLHWTASTLTATYYPPQHMCDTRFGKEKNENLVEILQGYVEETDSQDYNIYLDVINKSEYNITMTFNSSESNTHLSIWDGQLLSEEVPLTLIDGPWILYPGYNKILLIDPPYQTDLPAVEGVDSAHMAFDLTSDYLIGNDTRIWQI